MRELIVAALVVWIAALCMPIAQPALDGQVVGFQDGQCAEIGEMIDCEASEIAPLPDTLYTVMTWHKLPGKLN